MRKTQPKTVTWFKSDGTAKPAGEAFANGATYYADCEGSNAFVHSMQNIWTAALVAAAITFQTSNKPGASLTDANATKVWSDETSIVNPAIAAAAGSYTAHFSHNGGYRTRAVLVVTTGGPAVSLESYLYEKALS